jgi:hypothetical protein
MANQAPSKDEQNSDGRLPGKLREYMDLKNRFDRTKRDAITKINAQNDSIRKRKKAKGKNSLPIRIANEVFANKPDDKGAEVPLRATQKLKQMPFESETAYLNRVENVNPTKIIVYV